MAREIEEKEGLLKNLELFGAGNCVILSEDPARLSERLPGYFDKILIDAPCSGNGSCGKCRVSIAEGQADTLASRHITEADAKNGWVLACQSKVTGDITVEVPDIAAAYKSRMKVADLSSGEEIAIFEKSQKEIMII